MSDMDALRTKYLEMLFESASEGLTAEQRKASATVVRTKADGTKEYHFPIVNAEQASIALAMIEHADLSEAEKDRVRTKAERLLEAMGKKKSMPPWLKDKMEDEDEDDADDMPKKGYHKMPNGKMMKGAKHGSMKEGYGGYGKKQMMKEGWDKKKESMKEANGMIGSKADPNSPTNKKMVKDWEGGGDMGQTGDPKKKPVKTKKTWLAKGGAPASDPQPPSGGTPVVPD